VFGYHVATTRYFLARGAGDACATMGVRWGLPAGRWWQVTAVNESTKSLREPTAATAVRTVLAARAIRVFLGVLLIPVVLAATILLIQPSLDLTPFRGTIAQYLSSAMGHEVRLGGDLHVGLGRHVHLSVSEFGVANPAWAESAELFRATEASAGIDLFAMLSGAIRLNSVVLRDAEAFLEV